MPRASLTDCVRISGEGVKDEYSIGGIGIEFTKGFIRKPHMGNVIAVLCGEGTNLAELSITEVITITPGSRDRRRSSQGRLQSLRDEGRGQRLCG